MSNKPKYIYIDDERDSSVYATIDGLNDEGIVEAVLFEIGEDKSFDKIKESLLQESFDGLILDLKLDGNGPNSLRFRAPTLAQDLRTLTASENSIKPFPLILCSTILKMKATYDVDKSSHDLFDYKFLKEIDVDWPKLSRKLFSLAKGYNWLYEKKRTLNELFGRTDLNNLDPRILEKLDDPERELQIFDYTYFTIKELFHHPEPLIKERVLAARLGVDIEGSGKSWNIIKDDLFNEAKYIGLFNDGWTRWWSDILDNKFKEISGGIRLNSLNAQQRVNILIDVLGVKELKVAIPLPYCNSTQFWTICEGHKKPLDPLEGFQVYESSDLKPWQDSKYLSFDAAYNRIGRRERGLRPQLSEEERINIIKETLGLYE